MLQAVRAHAIVVAQHDCRAAEPADDPLAEILLRRKHPEFPGKINDLDPVNTQCRKDRALFLKRIEKPQLARVLLQDRTRMGPECDDHTLLPALMRGTEQSVDHQTVPQMDPVEESCSDYSHFTRAKSCLWGRSAFLG